MIEELNDEILSLVKQKLEEHFKGSYDDIFGITAISPHPYKLYLSEDIEHIVKKHTTHEGIIFYISNEIDIISNSLIDSMYSSDIYKKLNNKDMVRFNVFNNKEIY